MEGNGKTVDNDGTHVRPKFERASKLGIREASRWRIVISNCSVHDAESSTSFEGEGRGRMYCDKVCSADHLIVHEKMRLMAESWMLRNILTAHRGPQSTTKRPILRLVSKRIAQWLCYPRFPWSRQISSARGDHHKKSFLTFLDRRVDRVSRGLRMLPLGPNARWTVSY